MREPGNKDMRVKKYKKMVSICLALAMCFSGGGSVAYGADFTAYAASESDMPAESVSVVSAGDTIKTGGTYEVSTKAVSGTITVATTEPVVLDGSAGGNHSYLTIECVEGVNLTIQDLTIASPDNDDTSAIRFTGTGNTLTVEGENSVQNCTPFDDAKALICVPEDADLTINGDGVLSIYLKADGTGAGIGADTSGTCGRIVFDGATVLVRNTKWSVPIGGEKGGEVVFQSGEVVVYGDTAANTPLVMADAVFLQGGTVTLTQNGRNDYSILTSVLTVTGGSLLSDDATIYGDIVDGEGNAAAYCEVTTDASAADTTSFATTGSYTAAESDIYTVLVDGETFYTGYGHVHDVSGNVVSSGRLGLYLAKTDHVLTVNGVTGEAVWDEQSESFILSESLHSETDAEDDAEEADDVEETDGTKEADGTEEVNDGNASDTEDNSGTTDTDDAGNENTSGTENGSGTYDADEGNISDTNDGNTSGAADDDASDEGDESTSDEGDENTSDTGDSSGMSGTDSGSTSDTDDGNTSDAADGNVFDAENGSTFDTIISDTLCVRRGNTYYFSGSLKYGNADTVIAYGKAADEVLVGDWDGDGIDTLCVRRGNTYYFSNSLKSGEADIVIAYGKAADEVLAGDWDGDGADTLCVRRGNTYYFSNSLKSGNADSVIAYGKTGDTVLVGKWDGNASGTASVKDTLAVRRGNTYYFSYSLKSGDADKVAAYGKATDEVLVGDWNGSGNDTLTVRRGNIYYISNSIRSGSADIVIAYGKATDEVYAGCWGL